MSAQNMPALASSRRQALLGAATLGLSGFGLLAPLRAAESVTYLFPAPPMLPAFGPIQLAKGKGYFADSGLDVNFARARRRRCG
jgi:NitT/TauT family transport system substrate-binding protein